MVVVSGSHDVELTNPLLVVEVGETKKDLGGETICSELMTPGTDRFPKAENDLILGSSFHSRI
jgi:hypothetical protein